MLTEQIKRNRTEAFTRYVSLWKKQDPSTICTDGEIYSYTTKRGIVKKFKTIQSYKEAKGTLIKVNSFLFEEID